MKGVPTTFWGKLNQSKNIVPETLEWHPLHDHCADVAAVGEALLLQPTLRRRLARLGACADLTPQQQSRLCVFIALHDIGKHNLGFQNKGFAGALPRAGHVNEVASLLDSESPAGDSLLEALRLEPLLSWFEASPDVEEILCGMLLASVGHHGKPCTLGNPDFSLWKPHRTLDPFQGIAELRQSVEYWFPEAFQPGGEPLPSTPEFQHAFSGLVTLADWLGSNPKTEFFPFSNPGAPPRIDFARQRAARALKHIGLDPLPARSLLVETPTFHSISSYDPKPAQRQTLALPLAAENTITVLESETGSGKTEAALARFLQLFHSGAVDGMYFALPTRTAATQIYQRVCEAVKRAFHQSPSAPPVTLAVPGYLSVDGTTGQPLPGFDVLWNDDDKERFRFRGWASENPKRFLAGSIVVGTIDQVLLAGLAISHSHLRATSLLRHFLVVDEVHASDAYMNRLLEAVLERHIQAGGHALLMSATLGTQARTQLSTPGKNRSLPTLADAKLVPYPLLTHHSTQGESRFAVHEPSNPKALRVSLQPWIENHQGIAAAALEKAKEGARVVILRNTVRDCLATQEALETLAGVGHPALFHRNGIVAPHHARFSKEDRTALDEALELRFGKGSPSSPGIVVATQTIQQSLDLDFDLMLTDLCPMDVLLQRAGRVHRHEREHRPPGLSAPTLWVLVPEERDLSTLLRKDGTARGPGGIGSIYEDLRILEATWRLIEAHPEMRIPAMNRALVEESTHPEALAVIGALHERWQQHSQKVDEVASAHKKQAFGNLAKWSHFMGTIGARFLDQLGDKDLSLRIQTRLGDGDRLIQFETNIPGPFGLPVRRLTLQAHMARGIHDDAAPKIHTQDAAGFTFSFGELQLRYDRLGLRIDSTD